MIEERLARVEAGLEWLIKDVTRLGETVTTISLLIISGLAAIAYLVLKGNK